MWHTEHMEKTKHPARHTDWVFPAWGKPAKLKYNGLRAYNGSINKALKKVCDDLGYERITFHDLRRTFTTIALGEGISPTTIKSLTGHSDVMQGHYHHASKDGKSKLIRRVVMGTRRNS